MVSCFEQHIRTHTRTTSYASICYTLHALYTRTHRILTTNIGTCKNIWFFLDCIPLPLHLGDKNRVSPITINSGAQSRKTARLTTNAKQIMKRTILNNKPYLFVSFPRPSVTQTTLLRSENSAADSVSRSCSRSHETHYTLRVHIIKLFKARAKSVKVK